MCVQAQTAYLSVYTITQILCAAFMVLLMLGYANVMVDKGKYWFTIVQTWIYCSCCMLFYNSSTCWMLKKKIAFSILMDCWQLIFEMKSVHNWPCAHSFNIKIFPNTFQMMWDTLNLQFFKNRCKNLKLKEERWLNVFSILGKSVLFVQHE